MLIAGGGGDLGDEIARAAVTPGANVAFADLDQSKLNKLTSELEVGSHDAVLFAGDLCDSELGLRLAKETVAPVGGADHLVNCTGLCGPCH